MVMASLTATMVAQPTVRKLSRASADAIKSIPPTVFSLVFVTGTQVPANVTQKFKIGLDAFGEFDVDQSGTLDAAELQTLIDNKCDREPCPTAQEFLLGDAEEGRPGADLDGDGLLSYQEWVDFIRTDFENSGGCECDATDACDIAADGEACECDPQCFECPEEQPKACEQGDGFPICVGAEQPCPPVNCNNAGTECPGESVCTGMSAHCASSCDAETDCADGFHCWFEQGVCVPDGDVEVAWVECAPGDDTACSDGQFCFEFRECVDVVRRTRIARKVTDVSLSVVFVARLMTGSVHPTSQ